MNSDQLRYFELTYIERSYSSAARRVPVSHQGLTKSLRSLERELGVTLFESDPETGRPQPTPYADELYKFVQGYNSSVRLLHESFERLRSGETYEIRLGCSLGVLGAYGPGLISGFQKDHPQVRITYGESNDVLCERGLFDDIYDIALCVAPVADGCVGKLVYESPFYFWVRRDDPVAAALEGPGCLAPEDLAGRDIAIPHMGFKCYEQLKRVADEHGVKLGHIFETSEIFRLYSYAVQGRGLGFCNGTLVDLPVFRNDEALVALPVKGLTWGFVVEHLATHELTTYERAFCERCEKLALRIPGNTVGLKAHGRA